MNVSRPERSAAHRRTTAELVEASWPTPPVELMDQWLAALAELPPPRAAEPATEPPAENAAPGAVERVPSCAGPQPANWVVPMRRAPRTWWLRRGRGRSSGLSGGRRTAAAGLGVGVLAAAAATAGVLLTFLGPTGTAGPAEPSGQLNALSRPASPLADPAQRAGCLSHLGLGPDRGARALPDTWHGAPAVALLLPTETPGEVRTVLVTPDCGSGAGHLLAERTGPAGNR
ncbi:MAG TPA: hypothetical protein VGM60_23325 [Pseudonocardia sp.]|uniref:hypothetical protein n=1 Tax=Pseudonocardia sp. TaxID=60912 RepID=UPI002F42B311